MYIYIYIYIHTYAYVCIYIYRAVRFKEQHHLQCHGYPNMEVKSRTPKQIWYLSCHAWGLVANSLPMQNVICIAKCEVKTVPSRQRLISNKFDLLSHQLGRSAGNHFRSYYPMSSSKHFGLVARIHSENVYLVI